MTNIRSKSAFLHRRCHKKTEIFVKSINKVIFVMACPKSFQHVNTSTKIPNTLVKLEKITVII
jgi:hypothetical protein